MKLFSLVYGGKDDDRVVTSFLLGVHNNTWE